MKLFTPSLASGRMAHLVERQLMLHDTYMVDIPQRKLNSIFDRSADASIERFGALYAETKEHFEGRLILGCYEVEFEPYHYVIDQELGTLKHFSFCVNRISA